MEETDSSAPEGILYFLHLFVFNSHISLEWERLMNSASDGVLNLYVYSRDALEFVNQTYNVEIDSTELSFESFLGKGSYIF